MCKEESQCREIESQCRETGREQDKTSIVWDSFS